MYNKKKLDFFKKKPSDEKCVPKYNILIQFILIIWQDILTIWYTISKAGGEKVPQFILIYRQQFLIYGNIYLHKKNSNYVFSHTFSVI